MRRVTVFLLLLLPCVVLPAAPGTAGGAENGYTERERQLWSLRRPARPAAPEWTDPRARSWIRNPIDAFVLARLREAGLEPAPEADRRTLIRRLTFDLTGLPPSPAEIDAFLRDRSPDAYERLVDRLLGSPHHGERWGQHWLDVVRFAESEGFEYDRHLPDAWRFRDYIIRSFNADVPFDRLVHEQLAGDELEPGRRELQIAAGFHRLGAVRRNAGNQEVASSRNEVLTERTNIIGAAFLGLTLGCARCHDHKFDPIRQADYYRLQAFLAATEEHDIVLASQAEQEEWERQTAAVKKELDRLGEELKKLEEGPAAARLREKRKQVESRLPLPLPAITSIRNGRPTPIHVLERGDWEKKGAPVGMGVPGVLLPEGAPDLPLATGRPRTRLARWITDPANPLTARVLANRIWHYHFGRGIVKTPNDFGFNGDRPSHPELLDFLASRLVEGGWHLKPLHRMILLSSTYRQSSRSPQATRAPVTDPENRLLWRFRRRRLEAEEIRDAMLAASGQLNRRALGRSVIVPVDPELVDLLYKPSQWAVTPDRAEHFRRSVYLMAKRNLQLPFMEVFDQPTLQTSCGRRVSSTHAPQALELLNGRISNELAAAFAGRIRREAGDRPEWQVERAYLLATGRPPTDRERGLAVKFLSTEPLGEFALALFNINAFLHVD